MSNINQRRSPGGQGSGDKESSGFSGGFLDILATTKGGTPTTVETPSTAQIDDGSFSGSIPEVVGVINSGNNSAGVDVVEAVVTGPSESYNNSPGLMGVPDVVAVVNSSENLSGNANIELPSGSNYETSVLVDGDTTYHFTKISGPTIDPIEYATMEQRRDGSYLGWGNSHEAFFDSQGRLFKVVIKGSDDVSEILHGEDGAVTIIPVDKNENPLVLKNFQGGVYHDGTPADLIDAPYVPGAVDFAFFTLAGTAGSIGDIQWTEYLKAARSRGENIPGWAENIRMGRLLSINKAGAIGGAVTFIPAIIANMDTDGNTFGEALTRESVGLGAAIMTGAAIGTPIGGVPGAIIGGFAGAAAGYLASKAVQQEIIRSKGYVEDWMMPDDPDILRGYVETLAESDPSEEWAWTPTEGNGLLGYVPPPELMQEHQDWERLQRAASRKLAKIESAPRKADGGIISGSGGPRDDNLLAWVSSGEFVVNAASTAWALPLLEAINAGRNPMLDLFRDTVPRFSSGGPVGDADLSAFAEELFSDAAVSGLSGGLSGALSGMERRGMIGGLIGGIKGAASSVGSQFGSGIGAAIGTAVGGPVGTAIGSALGSIVGSEVAGGAAEIMTKPIHFAAETAKEVIGSGFGLVDLAEGPGGHTQRGDIYNISGMDPKSVKTAVERVRRRKLVAVSRGGSVR